jgi:hypothetical protein
MEHAQTEMKVVAEVIADANAEGVRELIDLQLAMVGGGSGEITPY